jgi:mRNA-degrading endonuclease YafQ of YafQ-DinJ toxin-antitoxin module
MYKLQFRKYFVKKYLKLIKNDLSLKLKVVKIFEQLEAEPFHPSLKSHKVQHVYSSRVTGDIRIIWQYNPDNNNEIQILELLDIGGHSGGNRVY